MRALVATMLLGCADPPGPTTPADPPADASEEPCAPVTLDPAVPIAGRDLRCVGAGRVTWTAPRLAAVGETVEGEVLPGRWIGVGDAVGCVIDAPTCGGASAIVAAAPDPAPPSILVLVIDDLGAYELAAYGAANPLPAPNLDRLAAQGVTFTRAWANPLCGPSRAALLTGRHAHRTGHGTNIRVVDDDSWFPLSETTIAEWVADAPTPFSRAAVGKWHLATWAEGGGARVLAHGFQTYRGALGNLYRDQTTNGAAADYLSWEKVVDTQVSRVTGYVTVDEVDDAIALSGSLPAPWLMYVGFHATHEPHSAPPAEHLPFPPPADLVDRRADFASMLAVLDAQIGRLLDAIPPDTHVVLVADNGDDEDVRPPDRGERQVKGSLFEGGARVPLIIRSPTVSTPGATSRALVDLTDLFPTLAAWAQRPATGDLDGRSLIPFLLRPDHADDATAYAERRQPNGLTAPDGGWERWDRAVRDDRFKLLRRQGVPDQLFDVGDALVDGPDLISQGLTPEAAAAYASLAARLDTNDVRD